MVAKRFREQHRLWCDLIYHPPRLSSWQQDLAQRQQ